MCLTIVTLADSWPWQLEPESVKLEHMICSAVISSASLLMRLMDLCSCELEEPESVELEHMICSAVINSASLLMRLMVSCEQDSTGDDMTAG